MDDTQIETIEQVRQFLTGSGAMKMAISSKAECYEWVRATLVRFEYLTLKKAERGWLLKYLQQVGGYSRAQITRMVGQYRETGKIKRRYCTANGFSRKSTLDDLSLLIALDKLHGTLSGPAIKKLCERAYNVYEQAEYKNLAGISVSHLYNLRHTAGYLRARREFTKTRPTNVKIGERRQPDPKGKRGMIRIDTVHQGDLDGKKGVYYINAVDEVTQFEITGAVEGISERFLIPLLTELLKQFPCTILGFHSDNGSEYVNGRVARLLNKLLIEFTKSRPRHSARCGPHDACGGRACAGMGGLRRRRRRADLGAYPPTLDEVDVLSPGRRGLQLAHHQARLGLVGRSGSGRSARTSYP